MDGDQALIQMIASVRELEKFPELVAKEAEREVLAEARRTAAAGTDPYGVPWAPRKEDNARALQQAAGNVFVLAAGATIRVMTRGVYAIHNGMRGKSRRQIIPDPERGIPPRMREIIRAAAQRVFARATQGGGR